MDTASGGRVTRLVLIVVGVGLTLLVLIGGPLWTRANEQAARPVTVSGLITDRYGAPLPEINVQIYRWTGHQWDAIDAKDTDAAGRYRFTGLPAGRITIAFEDDSGVGYLESWYRGWTRDTHVPFRTAAPGQHLTMNGRLILGGSITGRATFTDPSLGFIGATQFTVVAYPLIPNGSGGFKGIIQTTEIDSLDPTSDGNWRIQYLPAGSYVLRVVDNDEDAGTGQMLASRWIGAASNTKNWQRAEVFTVKAATTYRAPTIRATFDTAHPLPSLVLTVTGANGVPVQHAAVGFELSGPVRYSFRSGRGKSPFTNASGQVDFYRVIPGHYTLTVDGPGYRTVTMDYRYAPQNPGSTLKLVVALDR